MIQDISPHLLKNEYNPSAVPGPDSVILFFQGRDAAAAFGDGVAFPTFGICDQEGDFTYLFSIDDTPFFLALGAEGVPPGFIFRNVRSLRRETASGND